MRAQRRPADRRADRFDEALRSAPGILLLPYEDAGETAPSIAATCSTAAIDDVFALAAVSIFIGPEGGYEPAEVERAGRRREIVTLGAPRPPLRDRRLVAATLVMQALGELG